MRYVPLGRQWTRRFEEGRDQKKKSEKQQVGDGCILVVDCLEVRQKEEEERRRDGGRPTNGWSKLPLSNKVKDVCVLN